MFHSISELISEWFGTHSRGNKEPTYGWGMPEATRFNERVLKEARLEEECELFRQRTGRLEKWREAARAALSKKGDVDLPDSIEFLGYEGAIEPACIVGYCWDLLGMFGGCWKTVQKCFNLLNKSKCFKPIAP